MVNTVTLIGRVGKVNPLRQVGGNNSNLLNFTVATDRWKRDPSGQGEGTKETQWHNVTVWGKRAERLAQKIAVGCKIYISGRIEYSEGTDNQGNKRNYTNIVGEEVSILAPANQQQSLPPQQPQQTTQYAPPPPQYTQPQYAPPPQAAPVQQAPVYTDPEDDLPF